MTDTAHLKGANLKGANLKGANLKGANLKGANLKGELRGCLSKRLFGSFDEAQRFADHIAEHNNWHQDPYRCVHCQMVHLRSAD